MSMLWHFWVSLSMFWYLSLFGGFLWLTNIFGHLLRIFEMFGDFRQSLGVSRHVWLSQSIFVDVWYRGIFKMSEYVRKSLIIFDMSECVRKSLVVWYVWVFISGHVYEYLGISGHLWIETCPQTHHHIWFAQPLRKESLSITQEILEKCDMPKFRYNWVWKYPPRKYIITPFLSVLGS